MKTVTHVVLFDIDGTLLTSADGGPTAGYRAMNLAAEDVIGEQLYGDPMSFAGRTDLQIARALLGNALEQPSADQVKLLVARYVHHLRDGVTERPYRVLGDPTGAVRALAGAGAIVGLGTGNVREGASIKLSSAGVGDLFDLGRGGYGDDGVTRADLLEAGARRCDPGRALPVIIVGDTPHDVSAAHEIGAQCVGIPYRSNTAEVLRDAGADAIAREVGPELVPEIAALIGDRRR
ncbi:MAG: HAD family hydrolase [Deltaproteobacteria bacterium]|jgi:phosphoglycolate phosphatase-like HAD superfamily hydrolase|nr:HAD family hydrolase [Deltaproteobacteria bacterium]